MMKEVMVGVVSSLVAAVVIGFAGYILVVKENQWRIATLQSSLDEMKEEQKLNNRNIITNRLMLVRAHPDMHPDQSMSLSKLEGLSSAEVFDLAGIIEEGAVHPDLADGASELSAEAQALLNEHALSAEDLDVYSEVAALDTTRT